MPPAPTVQSLSDIVAGIQAAQAPENAQIDTSIASNETSGQAQTAGLNAAKTQAFGGIEQAASNKGMYFSGFAPDAEAKYTGSTYLPALAKLQSTIAATRDSLLGSKAKLATDANTAGLTVRQGQQDKLDAYNNSVIAAQAKAQSDAEARQNALEVASIRANATLGAASTRASNTQPTQAERQQADLAAMGQSLLKGNSQLGLGHAGGDGYVSPQNYALAKQQWVNAGYSSSSFDSNFSNYRNPNNTNYKVG